jgi:serine/threonine protein kinase
MVADPEFKDLTDIKLADLGISTVVAGPVTGSVGESFIFSSLSPSPLFMGAPNFYSRTSSGTPMYAAPEVISDQEYGLPADMWSLGVLCYIM